MSSEPKLSSLRTLAGRSRRRFSQKYLSAAGAAVAVTARRLYRRSGRFRFLDLPKELQEMVYCFVAMGESYEDIRRRAAKEHLERYGYTSSFRRQGFRLSLASVEKKYFQGKEEGKVCHEIRQEFLPVFFKEGEFDIAIGQFSKESRSERCLQGDVLIQAAKHAANPDDSIFLPRRIVDVVSPAVVFQDVRFVLYKSETPRPVRRHAHSRHHPRGAYYTDEDETTTKDQKNVKPVLKMSFEWTNKTLEVRGWPQPLIGRYFNDERSAAGFQMDDLYTFNGNLLEGPTVDIAREMCAREGFKGFTVTDLRRLADSIVPVQL